MGAGEVSGEAMEGDGEASANAGGDEEEWGIGNKLSGEIIGEYTKDCV